MSDDFTPPGGTNGDNKFKKPRDVDRLAGNVRSWWSRTFVFIKKTNVKTWKAVFIIAFVAGVAVATIWTVALKIEQLTRAAGETASLSLVADRNSINIGENTNIDIVLNGNNNPVVAVKAVVRYNAQDFALQSWDVSQGAFASSADPCQTSGHACEIISNAATCSTSPASQTIFLSLPVPGT